MNAPGQRTQVRAVVAGALAAGLGLGLVAGALLGASLWESAREPRSGAAERVFVAEGQQEAPAEIEAHGGANGGANSDSAPPGELAQGPGSEEYLELNARVAQLEDELAETRRRLAREQDRRVEREMAFLEYGRVIGGLNLGRPDAGPALEAFLRESLGLPPPEPPAPVEPDPEELAAVERVDLVLELAEARARTFNALLRTQSVVGFEMLEAGLEHADGWGPVVFRLLDGDGRLAGHLSAARMRLEGSKSGRSLAIVLVDGHEAAGGQRVPFEEGERRLVLRPVELARFAETFPQLFDPAFLAEPVDDGRWSLSLLRLRLNQLLAADVARGYHRLAWLGGVVGEEWRDVALEVRDPRGGVSRVLIADRMRVFLEGDTAVLELRDGVSERGGRRAPFLDGRLRIVLPRISREAWETAGLPGIEPESDGAGS